MRSAGMLFVALSAVTFSVGQSATARAQCYADLDGDGSVGASDSQLYLMCRDMPNPARCDGVELDVNGDSNVDACDLAAIRCRAGADDLGEICCTLPCDPACDADFNGDGLVNSNDVSGLSGCVGDDYAPECAPLDFDRDGDIDCYDEGAFTCLFESATPDPGCCDGPPCRCTCLPNVTLGDSEIDTADIAAVLGCLGSSRSGECARADVDCDGEITRCDADIVEAAVGGEDFSGLCDRTTCGACRVGDACQYRSDGACAAQDGDFSPGEACVVPPPPPGPGPGPSVPSFRGSGGCNTASGDEAPIGAALFLIGAVTMLLVRRRR